MLQPADTSTTARAAGGLAVALGLVILLSWALDIAWVKSVLPGAVQMKPNTAIGLLASGAALFVFGGPASRKRQAVASLLGLAVMALGTATLAEYAFDANWGIDQLLFRDRAHAYNAIPGRMAPVSTFAFACLGLALALLPVRRLRRVAWLLSLAVTVDGFIGALGYLWDARELVTDDVLPPIAIHTALAFIALGIGSCFALEGLHVRAGRFAPGRAAIELKFTAGLSAAFLLLLVGGGLAYRSSDQMAQSAQWATHVREIRAGLGQLYSALADAESAERAYLQSAAPQGRADVLHFAEDARRLEHALEVRAAGSGLPQSQFDRMRSLVAQRLDGLWRVLEARDRLGAEPALAMAASGESLANMRALRELARDIDDGAGQQLAQSEARAQRQRRTVLVTLIVTLVGAAGGFVFLLRDIRREMLARAAADERTRSLNADLERRVAERTSAAEATQRRFMDLFEFAPDALLIIDGRGTLVQVNRRAEVLFGWDRDELTGRAVEALVSPGSDTEKSELRQQFFRARMTGASDVTERDLQGLRRDGSSFSADVSLSPLNTGGEPLVLAAVRDTTERKRTEEEIRRVNADLERRVQDRTAELVHAREAAEAANTAKSAFLATMSHEIRTPMNGVLGMLEVLSHSDLSEEQGDAVRTIRNSASALLNIIDDILDFSKIEAGRLELERARVPLPELIEGICETLAPVAAEKSVDLSLFIAPQVPAQVWSDATRLRQIVFNLAGNAIKFSAGRAKKRGRVSLRVEVLAGAPGRVRLRFADNGVGMGPETLSKLFVSFTQGEASTTRRFGGTGLGLAICKRLVALMKGEIEVQSTRGEGSVFTVTLPFELVDNAARPAYPELGGLDCIIVGQDPEAGDLRTYLEHAGARVDLGVDLEAAARSAAGKTRAVVIHSASLGAPAPERLRAAFAQAIDVRHLVIMRGRQRGVRTPSPDMAVLDGNCLRRSSLLRAVAVAAGRASPRIVHDGDPGELTLTRAAPPTVAQARERGELILVAEDDPVNQKVILKQVELLGYAAEIADDGAEALRLWRAGSYALLLTDLHMPNLDGYGLAAAIRQEEGALHAAGGQRLPIVALTANALRGEATRANAAGMDDYLTKPVQLKMLKAALERWLKPRPPEKEAQPPSALPAPPAERAIDTEVLKGHIGDDPGLLRELLADYRASVRRFAEDLRAAHAAYDVRQIGTIAHKLKSSSRSVGALELGDACAELENACRAGLHENVSQGVCELQASMAVVGTELDLLLR